LAKSILCKPLTFIFERFLNCEVAKRSSYANRPANFAQLLYRRRIYPASVRRLRFYRSTIFEKPGEG
jgi:hypothetical protein